MYLWYYIGKFFDQWLLCPHFSLTHYSSFLHSHHPAVKPVRENFRARDYRPPFSGTYYKKGIVYTRQSPVKCELAESTGVKNYPYPNEIIQLYQKWIMYVYGFIQEKDVGAVVYIAMLLVERSPPVAASGTDYGKGQTEQPHSFH